MNTVLITIVLFTLACGALWHNQSPRAEDAPPSRPSNTDNEKNNPSDEAENPGPEPADLKGKASLRN